MPGVNNRRHSGAFFLHLDRPTVPRANARRGTTPACRRLPETESARTDRWPTPPIVVAKSHDGAS
jgi:hypothetical protein